MTEKASKVLTAESLVKTVERLKVRGCRIIFANGCFDILHVGHIRYLREARALGDILIVAVNDDASTCALKGEGRPWMKQEDRMEILSALSFVDHLVLFRERDVSHLLRRLEPHVHAKGTDYTAETVPERNIVLAYGGETVITGDPKTRSSTEYTARMRLEPDDPDKRP